MNKQIFMRLVNQYGQEAAVAAALASGVCLACVQLWERAV